MGSEGKMGSYQGAVRRGFLEGGFQKGVLRRQQHAVLESTTPCRRVPHAFFLENPDPWDMSSGHFLTNCLSQSMVVELIGNCSGAPDPSNLSEKYWQYISNLYCSTPPICNAVPCWLLNFGERKRRSTPPICTAVRLPFVPAMLVRKYQGLGVPESSRLISAKVGPAMLSCPKVGFKHVCCVSDCIFKTAHP